MTKTPSNAPATNEKSPHELKLQLLDKAQKKYQYQQDALIEVLHTAQETFGHLDGELLDLCVDSGLSHRRPVRQRDVGW